MCTLYALQSRWLPELWQTLRPIINITLNQAIIALNSVFMRFFSFYIIYHTRLCKVNTMILIHVQITINIIIFFLIYKLFAANAWSHGYVLRCYSACMVSVYPAWLVHTGVRFFKPCVNDVVALPWVRFIYILLSLFLLTDSSDLIIIVHVQHKTSCLRFLEHLKFYIKRLSA